MHPPLQAPRLSGQPVQWSSQGRPLHAWLAGNGPPLLLVHSINAAASAAEMRPLHERLQATHTVCSLDLPGFGHSDRSDRPYTPRLMTDAVRDAAAALSGHCQGQPVDALALSLSCEFLARAALEAPALFRSLALVSPTGLAGRDRRRGPQGSTLAVPGLLALLRGPGWGGWLHRQLTRPAVVRFFLRKTWGAPQIDAQLWQDAVAAARLPGAAHAPLHFLSGGLFSRDIQTVYERLALPGWMSHGQRGDFTDYRQHSVLTRRPNWRMSVYDTGAMPYFEQPDAFCADYRAFLEGVGAPGASVPPVGGA